MEARGASGGRSAGEVSIQVLEVPLLAGDDYEDQLEEPLLGGKDYEDQDQAEEEQLHLRHQGKGQLGDCGLPRLPREGGSEDASPLRRAAPNSTSQLAIVGSNLCPIESLDYEYTPLPLNTHARTLSLSLCAVSLSLSL